MAEENNEPIVSVSAQVSVEPVGEENSTQDAAQDTTRDAAQDSSEHQDGPAYGRMASEFPGWDPYVYGKPEKPVTSNATDDRAKSRMIQLVPVPSRDRQQNPQDNQDAENTQNSSQQGQNSGFYVFGSDNPFNFREFDANDPQKNPFYNHWDFYAIVAIIASLFTQTAVIALFFGIVSIGRTRRLHMRGRVLAIIAVILSVIQIGVSIYLLAKGITEVEFAQMVMSWLQAHLPQM